jgi:hypothetical protein
MQAHCFIDKLTDAAAGSSTTPAPLQQIDYDAFDVRSKYLLRALIASNTIPTSSSSATDINGELVLGPNRILTSHRYPEHAIKMMTAWWNQEPVLVNQREAKSPSAAQKEDLLQLINKGLIALKSEKILTLKQLTSWFHNKRQASVQGIWADRY